MWTEHPPRPTPGENAEISTLKVLFSGNVEKALTMARDVLRCATDEHGTGSLALIPSYTLLAEVYIRAGRLDRAELSLSHAKWSSIKEGSPDIITASLHRSYGLLCAAKPGKEQDALRQFASYTYHLSRIHGPEHVQTTPGYFHLGTVLARGAEEGHAQSMAAYKKVVAIWNQFFDTATDPRADATAALSGTATEVESLHMLVSIVQFIQRTSGDQSEELADALFALARFKANQNQDGASKDAKSAVGIYKTMEGCKEKLAKVQQYLQTC